MFGVKIITKSEYWRMLELIGDKTLSQNEANTNIEKLKKDCESLRKQINDKMEEINKLREQNNDLQREVKSLREFKRDTLEAMGQIDLAGFRLSYCTKKCKNCEREGTDCKKYEFGKHQYCVIPK